MLVIPAIDLLNGKAVRLHQGRYDEVTVYDEVPVRRAEAWRGRVPRLHVVDLEGAKAGHAVQGDTVRALVAAFGPGVQVGGGVRSREAFESYLALGARRVVLGSAAVQKPDLVRALAAEHPDTVILAVDAKDGFVATDGWTSVSSVSAVDLARSFADLPLAGVLYTDVSRDGTRVGPNVEATARLARDAGVKVIASGGVGTVAHLVELEATGIIDAVIVGRAIYDGSVDLDEALRVTTG
jgi:phosphoribosylformimino-5-aminoimidazole carboxamide ribotide isomerase